MGNQKLTLLKKFIPPPFFVILSITLINSNLLFTITVVRTKIKFNFPHI